MSHLIIYLTSLFNNTDSLKNKTSSCLLKRVIELFTQQIISQTLINSGTKHYSCLLLLDTRLMILIDKAKIDKVTANIDDNYSTLTSCLLNWSQYIVLLDWLYVSKACLLIAQDDV